MLRNTIATIFIVAELASIANGQQNPSVDWGLDQSNVQMSISLKTNTIVIGSKTLVSCSIRNKATNSIYAVVSDGNTADLVVSNKTGSVYDLTPPKKITAHAIFVEPGDLYHFVAAGETFTWIVPLTISSNIEPGEYELQAERGFFATPDFRKHGIKLTSNTLEIKITK
ncbi:MAG TPA: hypothetical protein VGN23_11600 [Verrucomicrobiae bacterium]|jgi:hypothetical protein